MIDAANLGLDRVLDRLAQAGLPQPVLNSIERLAASVQGWFADAAGQLAAPLGAVAAVVILAGFLTFYLLADGDRAWGRLTAGLAAWQSERLIATASTALVEVGDYLRATGLTAIASGVTVTVWLLLFGVPWRVRSACSSFSARFVPYVGAVFTSIVVVVMAFATGGVVAAFGLLVLLAITAVTLRWALARFVYRRTPRVHPAVILVVVPAAAALFGIAGLFLAVPIAATVITFLPTLTGVLGGGPSSAARTGPVPIWLDRVAQWCWRGLVIVARRRRRGHGPRGAVRQRTGRDRPRRRLRDAPGLEGTRGARAGPDDGGSRRDAGERSRRHAHPDGDDRDGDPAAAPDPQGGQPGRGRHPSRHEPAGSRRRRSGRRSSTTPG